MPAPDRTSRLRRRRPRGLRRLSLLDQRNARARLIRDRLATVQKAPEREPDEELALLRDEQLSKIPAFDTLLRRSERVSAIQDALAQAGMKFRAGNFLLLCVLCGIGAGLATVLYTRNAAIAWAALVIGAFLPYSFVSYRRQKRFEKFEELFPEAIDTLARAVRAGHAFTTALEMISNEIAEPVLREFRKLYEEQKFGMPVRDALMNLTERIPLVDVKFFVTAVMLQRETGGNLAEILDNFPTSSASASRFSARSAFTPPRDASPWLLLMAMPPTVVTILSRLQPGICSSALLRPHRPRPAGGQHRSADPRLFRDPQDY